MTILESELTKTAKAGTKAVKALRQMDKSAKGSARIFEITKQILDDIANDIEISFRLGLLTQKDGSRLWKKMMATANACLPIYCMSRRRKRKYFDLKSKREFREILRMVESVQ